MAGTATGHLGSQENENSQSALGTLYSAANQELDKNGLELWRKSFLLLEKLVTLKGKQTLDLMVVKLASRFIFLLI